MTKVIHHNLIEITKGMLLNSNIAKDVWNSKRSLVISQFSVNINAGTLYYLIDDMYCYGVIRFKPPTKISVKEFNLLYAKHLITNDERLQWWHDKEILFSYDFDILTRFDVPKSIEMAINDKLQDTTITSSSTSSSPSPPPSSSSSSLFPSSSLIHDFNFCEVTSQLLDNISDYDVTKYDASKLKQDLDITLSWLTYKHTGKVRVLHNLKDVKCLIQKLYSRIKCLDKEFSLDVTRLHPVARDFIAGLDQAVVSGNAGKKTISQESRETEEDKQSEIILNNFRNLNHTLFRYLNRAKLSKVSDYVFNDKILCVERYNDEDLTVNALLIKYCGVIQLRDAKNFNDISDKYPGICAEAFDLSDNVFMLACELDDNLDLDHPTAYITEILYLDNKNVEALDFHENQSLIHSLNLTKNIKEKMRIIVNSELDYNKAKQLMFNLSSEGIMIRHSNSDKDVILKCVKS